MRLIYSLVGYLALPVFIARLFVKSRKNPAYRMRIAERLGYVQYPHCMHGCIWLHAVSLGESIAAQPLINGILEAYPNMPLVITNTTPTGSAYIQKTYGDRVINTYLPFDMTPMLNKFLSYTKPKVGIIMETELWPNLMHCCTKKNIPLLLSNARLSEKSLKGYKRIARLSEDMLSAFDVVAAQSDADAQRFKALCPSKDNCIVAGNIKFDMHVPEHVYTDAAQLRQQWGEERPIFIAASTHDGEDAQVLSAFKHIHEAHPTALLVLVPRHPERFDAVYDACAAQFTTARRTNTKDTAINTDTQILLGDTMGELRLFFAASDIAFVGGSLVPTGGHNLLEPAYFGVPVLSGPYLFNFAFVEKAMSDAGALTLVHSADELATAVTDLISDKKKQRELGDRAKQVVEQNKGAVEKNLSIVKDLLEK